MRRILSFILLIGFAAYAQTDPSLMWKTVELEWEAVPGATGYEVKLTPATGGPPSVYQTHDNHLAQEMPVGNYKLQVRSKGQDSDEFSPWSEPIALEVAIKEIEPLSPPDQAVIPIESDQKQKIEFKWTPVDKIKIYTLKVWSEDRKDKPWVFTGAQTSKQLEVPPGQVYYWQVSFESATDTSYQQEPKTFSFTLQGTKLLKPEINPITANHPLSVNWKPSPDAKTYVATLSYRHLDEAEWTVIHGEELSTTELPTHDLKPGSYKIEVVAKAPRRMKSDMGEAEFTVKPTETELQMALKKAEAVGKTPHAE